jgi:undecaprenyl-diphosphatase
VGCGAALLTYSGRRDGRLTRRALLRAATPTLVLLGSAPINFGLRSLVGRVRPGVTYIPHHLPELSHPFQRWSYPAGHTMTALIVYGLLAYYVVRLRPAARWWVWALLALGLAAVGLSRVYLGVHWPTDVVGGLLAGGAWLSGWIALWIGDGSFACVRED